VPRLFDGELPGMNLGTNGGASCDPDLQARIESICAGSPFSLVANGRFRGGWITRHYGRPEAGVHAVQMELACRSYMEEPVRPDETNWPSDYRAEKADRMREVAMAILRQCVEWASRPAG
jgi:formiminoglutamase